MTITDLDGENGASSTLQALSHDIAVDPAAVRSVLFSHPRAWQTKIERVRASPNPEVTFEHEIAPVERTYRRLLEGTAEEQVDAVCAHLREEFRRHADLD